MSKSVSIDLPWALPEFPDLASDISITINGAKMEINGLPNDHGIDLVVRDVASASKYFVLHSPEDIGAYPKEARLQVSDLQRTLEARITGKSTLRDGGTTTIAYELGGHAGSLYIPAQKGEIPTNTFNGRVEALTLLGGKIPDSINRRNSRRHQYR